MEEYKVFCKEPKSGKHSYSLIFLHGLGLSAET